MCDNQPNGGSGDSPSKRFWLDQIIDYVFGYDFFISYTWKDGREYAIALTRSLESQGFDCFLDSDDYKKGDDWQRIGKWTLKRTSRLVLVATPQSGNSSPVLRELLIYSELGRQIIPICFYEEDSTATDLAPKEFRSFLSSASIYIKEPLAYDVNDQQVVGPSPHVVTELRDTFDLMRQDQWRSRVFGSIAAVVSCLFLAAVVLGYFARVNAAASARNERQAVSNQASSYLQLAKINASDGRWADEIYWYAKAASVQTRDDPQTYAAANFVAHRSCKIVNTLVHDTEVRCMAFSPDGERLAVGVGGDELYLWDVVTGLPVGEALRHGGPVVSVAFSPDGKLLICGTSGKSPAASLWNLDTHSLVHDPIDHDASVRIVCFTSDAEQFYTATETAIRQFATRTGEQIETPFPVRALAIAPATSQALVKGGFSTARSWDILTGKTTGKPMRVNAFEGRLGPDGERLLIGSGEAFQLWDPWTGELKAEVESEVTPVFTHDGRHLLSVNSDRKLLAWDALSGEFIEERTEFPEDVSAIHICQAGDKLLALGSDNIIRFLDPTDGAPLVSDLNLQQTIPGLATSWIENVTLSPDGEKVVIEVHNDAARLFDVASGKPIGPPMPHGELHRAIFGPHSARLITVGDSKANVRSDDVRLWNTVTGRLVGDPLVHDDFVTATEFSHDARFLATSSGKRTRLWKTRTGELVLTLTHDADVEAVSWSPDNELIATASERQVHVWSAESGQLVTGPIKHETIDSPPGVPRLSFSSGGQLVSVTEDDVRFFDAKSGRLSGEPIYGSTLGINERGNVVVLEDTRSLRLWDLNSRQPTGRPFQFNGYAGAFSSDGEQMAAGDASSAARIFSSWGKHTLAHGREVYALAFHPDGKTLLTGCGDGTARLWNVIKGERIGEPFSHEVGVKAVAFGPHGDHIAIATERAARIWDLNPIDWRNPISQATRASRVVFGRSSAHVLLTAYDALQVWDPNSAPPLGSLIKTDFLFALAVSTEGTVLTADDAGMVRLWNGKSGKFIRDEGPYRGAKDQDYAVKKLAFSRDGQKFAIGASSDVFVLETLGRQSCCSPLSHSSEVSSLTFTPNGDALLVGYKDNVAQLWNTRDAKRIGEALPHSSPVEHVVISHDGKRFVTIDSGNVHLWGRDLRKRGSFEIPGWSMVATKVVFSPDDTLILLASNKTGFSVGRLLDGNTALPMGPEVSSSSHTGIGFSANGELYHLGGDVYSARNHLRVWRVQSPAPLKALRFGADGQTLKAAGIEVERQESVIEFEMQAPALRDALLLPLAVEVRTGYTWDGYGNKRLLSAEDHIEKRRSLLRTFVGTTSTSSPDVRCWQDLSKAELQETRRPLPAFVP